MNHPNKSCLHSVDLSDYHRSISKSWFVFLKFPSKDITMSIVSIPDKLKEELDASNDQGSFLSRQIGKEVSDVKSLAFWRAALAEFVGCLLLVMFTVGMGLKMEGTEGPPLFQGAIGCGFFLAVLITALSTVSGGHVNPAISIGFLVTGQITFVRFVVYTLFQTTGAVAGAGLLKAMVPTAYVGTLGVINPAVGVTTSEALGAEVVITFMLLFVTMSLVDAGRTDMQGSVPLLVGLTVTVNILFAANLSGGCMNPVRNFGPALVQEEFTNVWIYWTGPMIGAVAGALTYDLLFATRPFGLRRSCMASARVSLDKNYNEEEGHGLLHQKYKDETKAPIYKKPKKEEPVQTLMYTKTDQEDQEPEELYQKKRKHERDHGDLYTKPRRQDEEKPHQKTRRLDKDQDLSNDRYSKDRDRGYQRNDRDDQSYDRSYVKDRRSDQDKDYHKRYTEDEDSDYSNHNTKEGSKVIGRKYQKNRNQEHGKGQGYQKSKQELQQGNGLQQQKTQMGEMSKSSISTV